MNYTTLIYLLNKADEYDSLGQYRLADKIDELVIRTAQFSGPNHLNLQPSQRAQPYKQHETELEDIETNKQNHPRLRVPEEHGEDTGDGPTEFGQDDPDRNTEDKEMTRLEGQAAPPKQGKYAPARGKNIFEMDDTDPAKGGSPFHMHGGGALGFAYVDPDMHSPSMRGLQDKNPRDLYNNPADRYKLNLPQSYG